MWFMRAYEGLNTKEREVVIAMATAMGGGILGPHNKVHPALARRVFDDLQQRGWLSVDTSPVHAIPDVETGDEDDQRRRAQSV